METALLYGTLDVEVVKSITLSPGSFDKLGTERAIGQRDMASLPEAVLEIQVAVRDVRDYDQLLCGSAI